MNDFWRILVHQKESRNSRERKKRWRVFSGLSLVWLLHTAQFGTGEWARWSKANILQPVHCSQLVRTVVPFQRTALWEAAGLISVPILAKWFSIAPFIPTGGVGHWSFIHISNTIHESSTRITGFISTCWTDTFNAAVWRSRRKASLIHLQLNAISVITTAGAQHNLVSEAFIMAV